MWFDGWLEQLGESALGATFSMWFDGWFRATGRVWLPSLVCISSLGIRSDSVTDVEVEQWRRRVGDDVQPVRDALAFATTSLKRLWQSMAKRKRHFTSYF